MERRSATEVVARHLVKQTVITCGPQQYKAQGNELPQINYKKKLIHISVQQKHMGQPRWEG
jgi:hypothetical protein